LPTEEEIVKMRIAEAAKRGIDGKAVEVAKHLGKDLGHRRHRYEGKGLSILSDGEGRPNLMIGWKISGSEVQVFYRQLEGLNTYRPDIEGWEEALDKVYESITPDLEREKKERTERQLTDFEANWGMRPS